MRLIFLLSALLVLAACGGSGGSRGGRSDVDNEACALIGDTAPFFGAGAQHFGYRGLDGMAGTCEFLSADGKRGGDVILYTPASLGGVTAEAQMQTVTMAWQGQTETPQASIDALGQAAQIANGLPGYQTQIAFRTSGSLVLISARSGDDAMTAEQLARSMATRAANNLTAVH